jgi:50S ribosomal subunit-associated GTPase HflX
VYDMADSLTLERAEWWLCQLRGKYAADIPGIDLVLAGNKCDMVGEDEDEAPTLSRGGGGGGDDDALLEASVVRGQELASRYGAQFAVVSAKQNIGVDEMFSSLALRIAARQQQQQQQQQQEEEGGAGTGAADPVPPLAATGSRETIPPRLQPARSKSGCCVCAGRPS